MNEEEARKQLENISKNTENLLKSLDEEAPESVKKFQEMQFKNYNAIKTVLNLLEKKDKQIEELKEIDEKRTWTVNNVIAEYIPDYELISLVNRYKDESFIPRVEVEKILNDRKK